MASEEDGMNVGDMFLVEGGPLTVRVPIGGADGLTKDVRNYTVRVGLIVELMDKLPDGEWWVRVPELGDRALATEDEISAVCKPFNKASKEEGMEVIAEDIPPKPTTPAPQGMQYAWDAKTKTWITVTGTILDSMSILSVFRDDIYPDRPQEIEVGARVYVRPAKAEGRVIRATDEHFRVEVNGATQPFWAAELETLPEK